MALLKKLVPTSKKDGLEILEGIHQLGQDLIQLRKKVDALWRLANRPAIDEVASPSVRLSMLRRRYKAISQNEEDGLLLAIFQTIGATDRRFVDIGCGGTGGNSGFLAQECGWTGLMIDGDKGNISKVQERYAGSGVRAWARFVTVENINDLLTEGGVSGELDLLSIDIDGNDYWLWQSVSVASPRLVIVEYNWKFGPEKAVTIPYEPDFNRRRCPVKGYHGASLAALTKLASAKGYRLLTCDHAGVNAFFLRNNVCPEVPGCEASVAFRTNKKTEQEDDIFSRIAAARLPLQEV